MSTPILVEHVRPYRIHARIKNNRLWSAICAKWPGVKNQRDAAKRLRVHQGTLGKLLNIQWWPMNLKTDKWLPVAIKISRRLGQLPDDLFDKELYGRMEIEIGRVELEKTGVLELPPAPDQVVESNEFHAAIAKCLNTLTPHEQQVLRLRYGLEDGRDWTLSEIGDAVGRSNERIRQIEAKALRKLRTRSRFLRDLAPEESRVDNAPMGTLVSERMGYARTPVPR